VHGAGLENERHPLIVAVVEVEVIGLEVAPSCCLMREVALLVSKKERERWL
jgi:hypothetical protein